MKNAKKTNGAAKMSDRKFCKILDTQYASWDKMQKLLFLECLSHELTLRVRHVCDSDGLDAKDKVGWIARINELHHRVPQTARDLMFSAGCDCGQYFLPGSYLLEYAQGASLEEGMVANFAQAVLFAANLRVDAVNRMAGANEAKMAPLDTGTLPIDTDRAC